MATHQPPKQQSAATFTSTNPVLGKDQVGFENDTGRFKVGDGTTAWSTLAYELSNVNILGQHIDGGTP